MKKLLGIIVLGLLIITSSQANDNVEIYLLNQLDDPRGFCIDIRGHKLKAKIDKGLQAHTCYSYQGEISPDQGFDSLKLTKNQFFLPSFNDVRSRILIYFLRFSLILAFDFRSIQLNLFYAKNNFLNLSIFTFIEPSLE